MYPSHYPLIVSIVVLFTCCEFNFSASSGYKPDMSTEYLLKLTQSSRLPDVDPVFDCAWRKMAMDYAVKIQPWISSESTKTKQLYDALQISTLCDIPYNHKAYQSWTNNALPITTTFDVVFYVDPIHGSDQNTGSLLNPFATLQHAVDATRKARSAQSIRAGNAAIFLRKGTYYLNATVVLGSQDSGLTISNYNAEEAVISGGQLVNVNWSRSKKDPKIYVANLNHIHLPMGIPAMQVNNVRATRARYPNANPELDLFPKGYITASTHWEPPKYHGHVCDPRTQCGKSINETRSVSDAWHGMYQNWTEGVGGACEVYDPPRSPWCSGNFYLERQFPEMHTRHPSGVSQNHLPHAPYKSPLGAIVHAWRPGHWYSWMFEVNDTQAGQDAPTWTIYPNQNNVYGRAQSKVDTDTVKYLGTFNSLSRCWLACNNSMETKKLKCNTFTWHHTDFSDPQWAGGCYMTVGGIWGPTPEEAITSGYGPHTENAKFLFGAGGNQGGEGSDTAAEWWIDNVFEELDAANEFFFDPDLKLLYFYYNGTEIPPSQVVVPILANLIELRGNQLHPVQNITLQGLSFTANRPTYMESRGNPSGGDWALERMAAVLLEGTEYCSITRNVFERLDSNAIFLGGYNRFARIERNDFAWLGQNAIASWGQPDREDGTNGKQPRFTTVSENFVREIGHYQKQSSFYFQAETAQTILKNNIVFNIPRAAVNFNDGFGGKNEMSQNLFFNTCRESSDHGAFNSWDRLPYITRIRDGSRSSVPGWNNMHHNFIVANYAADGGCLDNDDGSSYYDINNNFCVYGGHKSDFDGNNKISQNNIHAYPSVYGVTCLNIGAQNLPPKGYAEQYKNNICILPKSGSPYLEIGNVIGGGCLKTSHAKQAFEDGLKLDNNTIYVPNGYAKISCGGKTVNFKEFQSMGYDPSSHISSDMPTADTIIGWAWDMLDSHTIHGK